MPVKNSSPVSIMLIKATLAELGGAAHISEVFEKVKERQTSEIKAKYPTDKHLRYRITIVLSQSRGIERVGPPGSGVYRLRN